MGFSYLQAVHQQLGEAALFWKSSFFACYEVLKSYYNIRNPSQKQCLVLHSVEPGSRRQPFQDTEGGGASNDSQLPG